MQREGSNDCALFVIKFAEYVLDATNKIEKNPETLEDTEALGAHFERLSQKMGEFRKQILEEIETYLNEIFLFAIYFLLEIISVRFRTKNNVINLLTDQSSDDSEPFNNNVKRSSQQENVSYLSSKVKHI